MAETMTASRQKSMTDGQIDDLANKLRDAARKHRGELGSEAVQQVLGTDNLGMVLFAPFRKLVEAVSNMFVRHVFGVNRGRSPQEALDATGRRQYTTRSVVNSMPRGEGTDVDLKFFELDYDPTPTELADEYELRDLKGDPIALAKQLEDDPAFADERPVACQWDLGEDGTASYLAFYRWDDWRRLSVNRCGYRWFRYCRFAGVRK